MNSKKKGEEERIELSPDQLSWLSNSERIPPTNDDGKYSDVKAKHASVVRAIFKTHQGAVDKVSKGDVVGIILDSTPFYALSGGQVADSGVIRCSDDAWVKVTDVVKYGGYVLHHGKVVKGSISVNEPISCEIDAGRRERIAQAHTCTHLLGHALRAVLQNDEVVQKGSMVTESRLRLDFAHGQGLTNDQVSQVESLVEVCF
jgi:alanyl-tRNA synthetase